MTSTVWPQGVQADYFRVADNPGAIREAPLSRTPAVNLLTRCESGRQGCLKTDLLAGDRVAEFQKLGVQEISSIAGEARKLFERPAGQAVQRVAYQGMADGCKMDSDLMRAPRI